MPRYESKSAAASVYWTRSGTTVAPSTADDVILSSSGTAGAPGIGFVAEETTGIFHRAASELNISMAGTEKHRFTASSLYTQPIGVTTIGLNDGTWGNEDVFLVRVGANVLGLKNADNPQQFFVYGATTGSKYGLIGSNATGDLLLSSVSGAVVLSATRTPASNAAGTAGDIAWDADYIYICTATGAWKRAGITGGY